MVTQVTFITVTTPSERRIDCIAVMSISATVKICQSELKVKIFQTVLHFLFIKILFKIQTTQENIDRDLTCCVLHTRCHILTASRKTLLISTKRSQRKRHFISES